MKKKPAASANEAKPTPLDWAKYRVQKKENKKKEKEMRAAAEVRRQEKKERREEDERRKAAYQAREPDAPLTATQQRNLRARLAKLRKKQGVIETPLAAEAFEEPPAAERMESVEATPEEFDDELGLYEQEPRPAAYVCPGRLNAQWDDQRKAVVHK